MHRIFFENVRCFSSRQDVPLAPLTVLVGENSSGKSTFLALVRLAWDLMMKLRTPDFNEEPFLLGAFDQIVSAKSNKDFFIIGAETSLSEGRVATIRVRFEARRGQPALVESFWVSPPYSLSARYGKEYHITNLTFEAPSGQLQAEWAPTKGPLSLREALGGMGMAEEVVLRGGVAHEDLTKCVLSIGDFVGRNDIRPYAFAPIRTRPQRTYDPIREMETSEGSHVPTLLASTLLREPEWKGLIEALDAFGQRSGLFREIEVRRLGDSESDPFQIRVCIDGQMANLIDVGYGVSQVLPIVVDTLRGKVGGAYLLQQPEVHLHPKAQAELGSFLGALAKLQNKQFIIETHSDYLVDRIRMDIRDKKNGLRPEDVSLLYFERRNGEAQIHRLELDEQGNIVNAPPGYRSFFLEEERRFLGG